MFLPRLDIERALSAALLEISLAPSCGLALYLRPAFYPPNIICSASTLGDYRLPMAPPPAQLRVSFLTSWTFPDVSLLVHIPSSMPLLRLYSRLLTSLPINVQRPPLHGKPSIDCILTLAGLCLCPSQTATFRHLPGHLNHQQFPSLS